MELDDLAWKRLEIRFGSRRLDAFVSALVDVEEVSFIIERHKRSVVSGGGVLFHRLNRPPLEEVRTPGISGVGYRYPHPPVQEIWRIPSCKLDMLLDCLPYFGFPKLTNTKKSNALLETVKDMLLEFHSRKQLTATQIDESFVLLELVTQVPGFQPSEANQIVEFNRCHFGVRESKNEERDKIRNWLKKGFFTIGAI